MIEHGSSRRADTPRSDDAPREDGETVRLRAALAGSAPEEAGAALRTLAGAEDRGLVRSVVGALVELSLSENTAVARAQGLLPERRSGTLEEDIARIESDVKDPVYAETLTKRLQEMLVRHENRQMAGKLLARVPDQAIPALAAELVSTDPYRRLAALFTLLDMRDEVSGTAPAVSPESADCLAAALGAALCSAIPAGWEPRYIDAVSQRFKVA